MTKNESEPRSRPGLWVLVAPVIFLLVVVIAHASGLQFAYVREELWQFVPRDLLERQPLQSLWWMHAQPPGFNIVLGVFDRFADLSAQAWHIALTLVTMMGLVFLGDLIFMWTRSRLLMLIGAITVALIPGTLFYSSWVFYTQLCAMLLVVCVWGCVKFLIDSSVFGLAVSALSMLALFATRSSFSWVVAACWTLYLLYILRRNYGLATSSRTISAMLLIFAVMLIGLATARNVILFGSLTQSSWAAENLANVLQSTMTEDEKAQIGGDECLSQLATIGVFHATADYSECDLEPRDSVGVSYFDEPFLASGGVNYNYSARLALAERWLAYDLQALSQDPFVLIRSATQERGDGSPSGIQVFFSQSAQYPELDPHTNFEAVAPRHWLTITSWIPLACVGVWLIVLITSISRRRFPNLPSGYVATSVLVLTLSLSYIFLEYGENQRFRAELDPVFIALAMVGVAKTWALVSPRKFSI